jgi:erythritol transport system ATP-binding protein
VLSNGINTGEFARDEISEDALVLSSYKGHYGHEAEKEN